MYKKKPYYTKPKPASPDKRLIAENRFCDNILYNLSRESSKSRRQFRESIMYYAAYLQTHPDDLEIFNAYLIREYPSASVVPNLGRRLQKATIEKKKKLRRK